MESRNFSRECGQRLGCVIAMGDAGESEVCNLSLLKYIFVDTTREEVKDNGWKALVSGEEMEMGHAYAVEVVDDQLDGGLDGSDTCVDVIDVVLLEGVREEGVGEESNVLNSAVDQGEQSGVVGGVGNVECSQGEASLASVGDEVVGEVDEFQGLNVSGNVLDGQKTIHVRLGGGSIGRIGSLLLIILVRAVHGRRELVTELVDVGVGELAMARQK